MIIGVADTCQEDQVSVSENYTNALIRAGHLPFVLPCTTRTDIVQDMIKHIDGLLLPGGGSDVNPALYGEMVHPQMGPIDERRDNFELALIKEAIAQDKPILGICRGLQVINVCFGGTLYQDLPSQKETPLLEHQRPDQKWSGVHDIQIEPNSHLHQLLGCNQIMVNSTHHQSVKDVAPNFRITATAPDGVVEAIESDLYPILAVQFHPERLATGTDTIFTKLFSFISPKPRK